MKLMDVLANFNEKDRLTDGMHEWMAGELVELIADLDNHEYDLMYLHDGRVAVYRIGHDGTRAAQPAYVEVV
jgi:hypothetical protein